MQKSILPIVLLPSLALVLTACGSSEPPTIVIATPSASPQAQYKQADGNLSQELEKAQNELKALNEKLAALQSQEAPAASADTQTDTQTDTKADAQASNAPAAGTVVGASDTPKANPAAQASANAPATDTGASAPKPNEGQAASGTAPANTAPSAPDASAPKGQPTGVAAPTDSSATTPKESAPTTPKQTQPDGPSGAPANTQDGGASVPAQGGEPPKATPPSDASGTPTTVTPGGDGHTTVQPGSPVGDSSGADLGATDPAPKESVPPATSPEVGTGPSVTVPQEEVPPPKEPEPISIKEALDTLKAIYIPEGSEYQTAVIAIDPSTKSAISDFMTSQYYDTMATENLTLGGVAIELLPNEKVEKTLKGVAMLRQMQASDFANADSFNTNKTSFVGKTYGAGKYIRNDTGEFRYGVYNAKDGKTHLFIHGKQTSYDYPTKNVSYYGSAIMGKNGDYRMLEKSVKADLNIAENTLDITIKPDPSAAEKLSVKADIKAHKSGRNNTHTFNGESATMRVQGGFFGQEDVGGIFEVLSGEHKDENGVFGASANEKAKQTHPADF